MIRLDLDINTVILVYYRVLTEARLATAKRNALRLGQIETEELKTSEHMSEE
jgi:hypothetical protein